MLLGLWEIAAPHNSFVLAQKSVGVLFLQYWQISVVYDILVQ
jgi:hypothetical protein